MPDGVVRVTKKWIWKLSSIFASNFVFGLKKTSKETIALLKKASGDKCLSNLSITKWHKEFKDGWKSVHHVPRCGRPRTLVTEINTNTIASIIEDERHLSTRTLVSLLNILKSLGTEYERRNSKWNLSAPHGFFVGSQEQIELHLQLAKENLKKLQDPDYSYWERVITVDELWIYHYNPKLQMWKLGVGKIDNFTFDFALLVFTFSYVLSGVLLLTLLP